MDSDPKGKFKAALRRHRSDINRLAVIKDEANSKYAYFYLIQK